MGMIIPLVYIPFIAMSILFIVLAKGYWRLLYLGLCVAAIPATAIYMQIKGPLYPFSLYAALLYPLIALCLAPLVLLAAGLYWYKRHRQNPPRPRPDDN